MEDNQINSSEVIDLRDVFKTLLSKKKMFFIVWIITFILSCIIIIPVPRTYTAEVSVAPETPSVDGGALSSIASTFGFNIGGISSNDAFYPDIYPDVMASNDFIADLMTVNVTTVDGEVKADYYTYLKKHQKKTFYMIPVEWVKRQIKSLTDPSVQVAGAGNAGAADLDPKRLSELQTMLFEMVRNNITCSVDKKTGIITITVVDQDPVICAAIADSAMNHLQNFITDYRTNKARIDYEYYLKLTNEAKAEYDLATKEYGEYCDSHFNSVLQSVNGKREELENDLGVKMNTYNAMNTQLAAAKAKIQECTPAFSLLQSPTVPVKPTGPKRMIFVAGMLFLATLGTCIYIAKGFIMSQLTNIKK